MARLSFARMAFFISSAWLLGVGIFYYPKWNYPKTEAALSWDVSGYYFYLPAVFIYNDLKQQKFRDSLLEKYEPATSPYQSYRVRNGNYVMKYSAGMALMYAPFFFIADALAKPLGYERDGFSYPYQLAIGLGSLLFGIAGLFFLSRILSLYFSSVVTGSVLLLYVFGTNYLEYAAISNAMSHNYLFALYALLILATIMFYRNPSYLKATLIGLLCGLATITRPTEVVSVLIPLLWGIGSLKQLRERFLIFRKHKRKIFLSAFCFALVVSIQFIYWKYVSGNWIVYSYQNEKLEFFHPHFYKCLLSFRKGWFIYTPVMMLIIPGYYFLFQKRKEIFWACIIFSFVFMYLCFSWSIWWYAGSIGQRAMVQAYPLLAFPFAAFLEKIVKYRKRILIALPFFLLVCYYNLWLHHQAHKGGLLDAENMTRAYWNKILFRYRMPVNAEKLLDTDEEFAGERKEVHLILENNTPVLLDISRQFSDEYFLKKENLNFGWLRVNAWASINEKEWNVWSMTQMIVKFIKSGKTIKEKQIRIQRLLQEKESKQLFMDVQIPVDYDNAEILFWNSGGSLPITITHFNAEGYN